jgi:predicted transcriptional regulator
MRISDQEANRSLMLKAIRREEPVARTELTRLTGLASATVTEIVGDLVRRKIVLEAKGTVVGRGRPRMQLLLNPDAAYVLSGYLHPDGWLRVECARAWNKDPLAG